MRLVLAFIIGWSFGVMLTIIPFRWWDAFYRTPWDRDRPGSEAVAHAMGLVSVAAFVAALAVPFFSIFKKSERWPILSFILGILTGACTGFLVDGWCIYAILLDQRPPLPPVPGLKFFVAVTVLVLAIISGLLFLARHNAFDDL
jgi:hypothetical protein